jgi:hypothetical protein
MANGDTPIVISDGSLTIESAVPWSEFHAHAVNSKAHPHAAKTVTKVAVTSPGNDQTVTYSGEQCEVAVQYGTTGVTVATDQRGNKLRVSTEFDSFQPGPNPTQLLHKDPSSKISHVKVTKGDQTAFDAAPSGGTRIVISYQ